MRHAGLLLPARCGELMTIAVHDFRQTLSQIAAPRFAAGNPLSIVDPLVWITNRFHGAH